MLTWQEQHGVYYAYLYYYRCVKCGDGWIAWFDAFVISDGSVTLEQAKADCQKHYDGMCTSWCDWDYPIYGDADKC